MLIVKTIGRIRREHLVKGKSIKEIARGMKILRDTVRRVIGLERSRFLRKRRDPVHPFTKTIDLRSIAPHSRPHGVGPLRTGES